ncbi:MAG: hypothetical protein IPN46_18320 [Saprospiraceae bacterium]|nr:hypothetical protein [Saprospiraceae bacterium]
MNDCVHWNTDYDAKRYKDMALMPLKMNVVPTNTFNLWLKHKGKPGTIQKYRDWQMIESTSRN